MVDAVRIEGIDTLLAKVSPAILKPAVLDGFEKARDIAEPEVKRRMPAFSGRMRRAGLRRLSSRGRNPTLDPKGHYYGKEAVPEWAKLTPKSPTANLTERGTRPHFPETRPNTKGGKRFRRFVQRTLKPQAGLKREKRAAAIDSAVYLVARAISRRGTPARGFMRSISRALQGRMTSVLETMRTRIEREWQGRR